MMKTVTVIIGLALSPIFYFCNPTDYCDPTTPIEFRGVTISFPQSGLKVHETEEAILDMRGAQLYIDSLTWNSKTRWFLSGSNLFEETDTVKYLQKTELYGVTFAFPEEPNQTKEDLVDELEKQLSIKFEVEKKPGREPYYLYHKGCLAIMVHHRTEDTPLVSFCYGLGDDELMYYAHTPGRRWFD